LIIRITSAPVNGCFFLEDEQLLIKIKARRKDKMEVMRMND
jgi:hypothetical protein